MKKAMLIISLLLATIFFACGGNSTPEVITISGAWALYPMAQKWAEVYQATHPGVRIDISGGGAGKGMTDVLSDAVDIGMVSRAIKPEETQKGALAFAVAKDAVVATMNADNPFAAYIRASGVTREQLRDIFTNEHSNWLMATPAIAHAERPPDINLFTRADACGAAQTWAAYLDSAATQEKLKGTGVSGDPGMAEAVGKDPLALGYNNIGFAYDPITRKPYPHLAIVPLDQNGNGMIDPDEQVYDTLDTLVNAINLKKYPSPPARNLYFVTHGFPARPAVIAYLRWVLNEGQREVAGAGFVQLPDTTLAAARAQLGR